MEPGLLDGDYVLVSKINYGARLPRSLYEIPWVNLLTYLYPFNLLDHESTQSYKKLWPNQSIKRNDIIVFNIPVYQKQFAIKRCMQIPGDTIFGYDGTNINILPAYQDNVNITTTKIGLLQRRIFKHYRLHQHDSLLIFPFNYYFVEGDNKDYSTDSRTWGALQEDHIVGKACIIVFSKEVNGSYRWNRFFKQVK